MTDQFAAYPSIEAAMNARYRGHDTRDWEVWRAKHSYGDAPEIEGNADRAWINRDKINYSGLGEKTALRHLIAANVDQPMLDEIGKLTKLERLELEWPMVAPDLSPLAKLTKLRHLSIDSPRKVESFSVLAHMPMLRTLLISNAKHLNDLEWLRGADHLQVIGIEGAMDTKQTIASLDPLAGLKSLEAFFGTSLRLVDPDLTPLTACPSLKYLGVARFAKKPAFDALREARPDLNCMWFDDASWGKSGLRPA